MLGKLHERNQFHLGLSKKLSEGKGIGPEYAEKIWDELQNSKASETGLLKDLEDTCLFIDGIGDDRISDAVCNIISRKLIEYTHNICSHYKIPIQEAPLPLPTWNASTREWEDKTVDLPCTPYGPLILVPKGIVVRRLSFNHTRYYRSYVIPCIQENEKKLSSSLVQVLKNGGKHVFKKDIIRKYGASKQVIAEKTKEFPASFKKYKAEKNTPPEITDEQIEKARKKSLKNSKKSKNLLDSKTP